MVQHPLDPPPPGPPPADREAIKAYWIKTCVYPLALDLLGREDDARAVVDATFVFLRKQRTRLPMGPDPATLRRLNAVVHKLAVEVIATRYRHIIADGARTVTRDASMVQDAVQDALLRLPNRSWHARSMKGFLMTVGHNAAVDLLRREPPPSTPIDRLEEWQQPGDPDVESQPEQAQLNRETRQEAAAMHARNFQRVLDCLGTLSANDAALLRRYYLEDAVDREIAAALGEHEATIKRRRQRATQRLRDCVAARQDKGDADGRP
jgi:RNA polymerase sigma factor (sigma-70 family)